MEGCPYGVEHRWSLGQLLGRGGFVSFRGVNGPAYMGSRLNGRGRGATAP
jgi:hypothetical protein